MSSSAWVLAKQDIDWFARDKREAENPQEVRPERAITSVGQVTARRSQLRTGHLLPVPLPTGSWLETSLERMRVFGLDNLYHHGQHDRRQHPTHFSPCSGIPLPIESLRLVLAWTEKKSEPEHRAQG